MPPVDPERLERQPDGTYIEYDSDRTPLGTWEYNPDTDEWEFLPFDDMPLSPIDIEASEFKVLPQTGMLRWPIPVLTAAGTILLIFGSFIIATGRKRKRQ